MPPPSDSPCSAATTGFCMIFENGADAVDVGALEARAEFLDVGACGEIAPRSGNDNGLRFAIGGGFARGDQQPVADGSRKHVQRGMLDRDNADALIVSVCDWAGGHGPLAVECCRLVRPAGSPAPHAAGTDRTSRG